MNAEASKYTKKDFVPEGDVKWCSGCGDYSILNQVQKVLGDSGKSPDEVVFISGIGCSSRFTYYMNTYGYHTIHGRALAIATGTKAANPKLDVWVAMGDGDGLSIGGNHFLHAVRRNLDITCILMDNRIYGLTKGQFSPTSRRGQVTKTSPFGTLESPVDPVSLALGLGCSFVARSIDRNPKHLGEVITKAHQHKGFSLVHVNQNCPIFNDGAYAMETGDDKADNTIYLEHGQPMIFGKESDKAIVRNGFMPKVVAVSSVGENEILIHDENATDPGLSLFLSTMKSEAGFPTPMGVFRSVNEPTFDGEMQAQVDQIIAKKGKGNLQSLLNSGETWVVK